MFRRAVAWLGSLFRRPWHSLAVLTLLGIISLGLALVGRQVWAGYHYRSAGQALERYRLAEAQAHLEQCLRVWPSRFEVRLRAAQTSRRLGDLEAADRHLARCQEIRGGQ